MVKRFRFIMLVALIMPVIALSGCELFEKAKDNSSSLLLLAAGGVSHGTLQFVADGVNWGEYQSLGFEDPGSGNYQQAATLDTRQFWMILNAGHSTGCNYDQTQIDITYIDSTGTFWVTDDALSFTLYFSTWSGNATGTFSGTLKQSGGAGTILIQSGTFDIEIIN
jgi:hypothetical protein